MSIIDRITGAKPDPMADLFDRKAEAVARLQSTIQQLAKELKDVAELSDQIWRELPQRPLSVPPTFGRNLLGRVELFAYGATGGMICRTAGMNAFVASRKPDLVSLAADDRKYLESFLAKTKEAA